MKGTAGNTKIKSLIKAIKPWLAVAILVVVLRYTGAISGISFLTQSALFQTGLMDYNPEDSNPVAADFDYNFTMKDLYGNDVDAGQFRDKVIFLNLWATWCGPCRVEMPSIQKLYESVDKEKVVFVMLALDSEETRSKVSKYIDDKGFTFPVYVPYEYLPKQLQVRTIPTTFIIGKDGKIKTKKTGTANYDTKKFRAYINDLANQ